MLTNPKAKGRGHSNSADKAGFLSIVRRVTRGNKGIHAKVLDHHRPLMGKSLKWFLAVIATLSASACATERKGILCSVIVVWFIRINVCLGYYILKASTLPAWCMRVSLTRTPPDWVFVRTIERRIKSAKRGGVYGVWMKLSSRYLFRRSCGSWKTSTTPAEGL